MSSQMQRLVAGVTVLLVACRYQPPAVQMQGQPNDISAIAGSWSGEYSSAQSGRGGSILFAVRAGSDTAFGDVMMTPTSGQPLMAADVASRAHAMHATAPEQLRVTFVRVASGQVEGALEPYEAPDCHCVVSTVFRGTLQGDRIKGEYVTRGPNGLQQTGAWSVKRKA